MNELKRLILNGKDYVISDEGTVAFDKSQDLTPDQKKQARSNIGAASGDAGVHVGSDMPPDGVDIWIDPSGEPTSTEQWEFDMEDGTTETKTVVVVS